CLVCFFSSRRRHTRYWRTGVQTCALPISQHFVIAPKPKVDFFLKETKPGLQQSSFDSGWLARAHWASTAFDFSTTGHASETCHRSEERRVGKECRYRWYEYSSKKKQIAVK